MDNIGAFSLRMRLFCYYRRKIADFEVLYCSGFQEDTAVVFLLLR